MPSFLENRILEIISQNPHGIMAKDIAKKLNVTKGEVNSVLYSNLKSKCYQDSSFKWYSTENIPSKKTIINQNCDEKLRKICKYYLSCLNVEENNGISEFLTSKYDSKYEQIDTLDNFSTNENIDRIINRVSTSRNLVANIGYPVSVYSIYGKDGQRYLKIAPIFLFQLEINNGCVSKPDQPSINIEVVKQYSKQDSNSQIYDLINLGNDLGLNDSEADFDIDDIALRLQDIRQWNWKENLNPSELSKNKITEITEDGIYNSAIIVMSDRSTYTAGLENELSALCNINEETYKCSALYDWIHV